MSRETDLGCNFCIFCSIGAICIDEMFDILLHLDMQYLHPERKHQAFILIKYYSNNLSVKKKQQ